MPDSDATERDEKLTVSRRDVLKGVGAAGVVNAFGTGPATATHSGRLIVGTTPGHAEVATARAGEVSKTIDFGEIGQAVVGRWPEEALQGLRNNPHVEYIEEEAIGHTAQQELPWGVDRVDAEITHDSGDTGSGTDIGIVDTGIDVDHPDLVGNLADPTDSGEHSAFVDCVSSSHPDGTCDEDWDDDDGHGTHVAGTAAAVDNARDVVGVAPDATLHAIKTCDDDGDCPCGDVADGIRDAADEGYDVANVSIGGCGGDTVENAVDYAVGQGTVVVAAAGNSPCADDDCVQAPARFGNAIAVSSTNSSDGLRSDSSTGPEIDLAAPGNAIPSTWNDGGTNTIGGTSMASPHVAGAALQLIANGTSPSDVRGELTSTAEDIGLSDPEQGAGLLDAANALGHDSANDLTEVETRFADTEYTSAELFGRLLELTGNDSAEVFFQYRRKGTSAWTTTATETMTSFDASFDPDFEIEVTGLEEDTTYEFRAGVTVTESTEGWSSTEHGDIEEFDTVDNPDPTALFTHDPDVPDPDQTVTFDASASEPGETLGVDEPDSIVSYEWDFTDDGTFDDTGETVTHAYPDPGNVTVRLRVTDAFDQTDEVTAELRVNAPPEPAFDHSPTLPNEGESVEFDASASVDPDGDIVEYTWDFGDGTTATTTDPVIEHTYAIGDYGEHDVTLTVTDDDDATGAVTETIRVNAFPEAAFDVVTDPPVRDEPIEFDASASADRDPEFGGEIAEYEWDFGDGTTETTTDPVVEHTYTTGGAKTVRLRVTDNDGASHDDLSVHEESFTVRIRVTVAIKPDDGNAVNPRARGTVPVAVLRTAAFDPPARLDHATVHFGDPDDVGFDSSTDPFTPEGGATPAHSGGHVEDVDADGDADSMFHFPVRDADFESDDTEGKLVGLTDDGVPVFGSDSVDIIGGGGP